MTEMARWQGRIETEIEELRRRSDKQNGTIDRIEESVMVIRDDVREARASSAAAAEALGVSKTRTARTLTLLLQGASVVVAVSMFVLAIVIAVRR